MTTLTTATTTDVRRALLTLLVAVPWSLGWLAGALVNLTLYAVTAARLGFTDARQSAVMTPTTTRRGDTP